MATFLKGTRCTAGTLLNPMTQSNQLSTQCCIVGGGPCGMMLGVLLARAGIDVVLLEKYGDFFRDFRGDTIHPSTLQLLDELDWLDAFLALPHNELREVGANVGGEFLHIADFSKLPTRCKFIAFMPQWDFLNFLAERGRRYPAFHLMMETEGVDLIQNDGRVVGVRARTKTGELVIQADLVVGTDGRHSTVRERAGFEVENLGAPMDVLWMRISKRAGDPPQALGTIDDGQIIILIDRNTYWQCAYIIPKGSFEKLKAAGLAALHDQIVLTIPALRDRVDEIDDWSKVSLLEVRVDRLARWHRSGLLCIGDAAHAMSPIGGVGINLAIQDAVAAANRLVEPLRAGDVPEAALAAVQERRAFPTRVTQAFQVFIQNRAIDPLLQGVEIARPPLALRLLEEFPYLRRFPALLLGLGVRPERVSTPERNP
jgi:2-polyprenyl-6-methoxyphenol hydroxylase-like FAD-dependent oxidoreductase